MKQYVKLYKIGNSYNAYGIDSWILNELLGYKYVEYRNGVGFPVGSLNKVKNVLDKEKISYKVFDKDIFIEECVGIDKNFIRLKNKIINKRYSIVV